MRLVEILLMESVCDDEPDETIYINSDMVVSIKSDGWGGSIIKLINGDEIQTPLPDTTVYQSFML